MHTLSIYAFIVAASVAVSTACKKDASDDDSSDDCDATTEVCDGSGGVASGGGGGGGGGTSDVAPVPGSGPSFSDITKTGYVVSWAAATDDATAAADLEYQLVSADSSTELATLEQAQAIAGAGVAMAWTKATLSMTFTDIPSSQTTTYAVLVRDAGGLAALYPAQEVTTLDQDAPTPGSGIITSMIVFSNFSMTWGMASSEASATNKLKYKAVIATSSTAIDTAAEAAAATGGAIVMDWTENYIAASATSLHFGRVYYVSVVVKDEEGRMALYSPVSAETTHHKLIYVTSQIYPATDMASTAGVDAACNANKPVGRGSFKALYAGGTRTACTNAYCNPFVGGDLNDWALAPTMSYESVMGELIWTTDNNAVVPSGATIAQMTTSDDKAWTGLTSNWRESATRCSNWSSISSGVQGEWGWTSNLNSAIWSSYVTGCSTDRQLICVEQ